MLTFLPMTVVDNTEKYTNQNSWGPLEYNQFSQFSGWCDTTVFLWRYCRSLLVVVLRIVL